jgi:flagellar hook-length control protein FliK
MVKEGVVTAQLETESAAARTVLLDNLPALRERLAEQEIRIEKFDVNVGRENQQQTDHSEAEQRRKHRSRVQAQKLSAKNATTDTSTLPTTSLDPQSELDVRI